MRKRGNPSQNVKIALIQMSMSGDAAKNIEKAMRLVRKAAKSGAKIVALPELFAYPYFPQAKNDKRWRSAAEKIPGKLHLLLSRIAKQEKIVLVAGSLYEKAGNKRYNTSLVFNEQGKQVAKYRKLHVPHDPKFYEQHYFAKGNLGYVLAKTSYGNLGVLICYDQWFPEAARILALKGAGIIFYPTAIGSIVGQHDWEGDWRDAWETVQRGHSIANSMPVAAINRCGREKQLAFFGGSFITNAFGKVIARSGSKEKIMYASLNMAEGKKVNEKWRFFYERRPDTYAIITKRK